MRSRNLVLVIVAVIGGMAALGCGLGALVYIVFVHEFEEPVTQADRDVLVTVERLIEFVDVDVEPARATAKRVRKLDGSREVRYEYESPDGAEDPLYLSSAVNLERNASDARTVYLGATVGFKLGMALGGDTALQEVVKPDLLRWGDESRAVVLMKGDTPVGNVFVGRKGRRVFHVVLVGAFFDEREHVDALLGPVLQRYDAYNP
jgi:hypothetical protein